MEIKKIIMKYCQKINKKNRMIKKNILTKKKIMEMNKNKTKKITMKKD